MISWYVMKICSKFTQEHPCRNVISSKLQSNFIEITLQHKCFPVNLLHIFRTLFLKNTSGRHDVKVEPGPREPPESLKVGPGTSLKFKSGTPGPLQNLKVGLQDPLKSLKVGPPYLSLMNSFFSEYFFASFTYLFLCLF